MTKKRFYFEINGFFRGEVEASGLWTAKLKAKTLYRRMFVGEIKSITISVSEN